MEAQATNERNKENVMKKRKKGEEEDNFCSTTLVPTHSPLAPAGGPTLHQQFVLPLTLSDAVVHLAVVDAVV